MSSEAFTVCESPGPGSALLIVDLQIDFCAGGALPVPEGDAVVEPLNRIMPFFPLVVATREDHPEDHCSFREHGGPWPRHCVPGTPGNALHPGLRRDRIHLMHPKATLSHREQYSGFDETDLEEKLRQRGARHLYVGGLATDYCVRATVLDALKLGFEVTLLLDCVRAVNFTDVGQFEPGDGEKAIREMVHAGARVISSGRLA